MNNKMFNLIWIVSLLQFNFACHQRPEAETYLIPVGFKGKVNVIFNQPKGVAVQHEKGRRIYRIPENGILLTQFKDENGFVDRQYYLIDTLGMRFPLKIFLQEDENNDNEIGIFRDGTTGTYGDSKDSKSLVYHEFYVTDSRNLKRYFLQEYEVWFEKKVKELTGYDF